MQESKFHTGEMGRPKFDLFQMVNYSIHEHGDNQRCVTEHPDRTPDDRRRPCQRTGYITTITTWRRGDEFGYRVTDQFGNFFWIREKHLQPVLNANKKPTFDRKHFYHVYGGKNVDKQFAQHR